MPAVPDGQEPGRPTNEGWEMTGPITNRVLTGTHGTATLLGTALEVRRHDGHTQILAADGSSGGTGAASGASGDSTAGAAAIAGSAGRRSVCRSLIGDYEHVR